MDLSELFIKYGSDKDRNGYAQVYHTLFHDKREEPIRILEIGSGTSLKAWKDFFPQSKIYGIGSDQSIDDPQIEIHSLDSTKADQVTEFMKKFNEEVKYDLIIDSSSASDMEQLNSLRNWYPHLKTGGHYMIEGITTESRLIKCPSLVSCFCNHDPYFFAGIKNNLCVIYRRHLNSKRQQY